jgi:hypothetical protein
MEHQSIATRHRRLLPPLSASSPLPLLFLLEEIEDGVLPRDAAILHGLAELGCRELAAPSDADKAPRIPTNHRPHSAKASG